MKRFNQLTVGCMLVWMASAVPGLGAWLTDYPAAQAQAQRENKTVLLNFTGSDWCGWCIKLDREVFSQPEFLAYAAQHLVLVKVDFPKKLPISAAQKAANQQLAGKYQIRGYPTLILLDARGELVGKSGYQAGGAQAFVQRLAEVIGSPVPTGSPTPAAGSVGAGKRGGKPAPLYGGATLQPPPKYEDFQLKGISGTKQRRFALVNNHTFMEGETAAVKFKDERVRVHCVKIKEDSVIIEVGKDKVVQEVFLQKSH